jgi:broad specificity phosphatase PhoE
LLLGSAALADTKIVPCEGPVTTIIIVRHADRAGTADSLSAAGVVRANDLAQATKTAKLRAIYVSDTRRARDTAAPAAAAFHLQPETYPAKECDALVKRIMHDHLGEAVLIVGHSNTVPMLIAAAGGPKVADIDEKEFDGLYVVAVTGAPQCGATMVQLQYGAASP